MKYLVFTYRGHYPVGGMNDFTGFFTPNQIDNYLSELKEETDLFVDIVDMKTLDTLYTYYFDYDRSLSCRKGDLENDF